MKTNNIYSQLIENLGKPIFRVDVSEDSSFEIRVVDAINQLYTKKNRAAYQALEEKYEFETLSDGEKSLFLEAKISDLLFQNQKKITRSLRNKNWKEIVSAANEALLLNPHAAISRAMLARDAFISGKLDKGTSLLLEVLEEYPEAKWIYMDIVRFIVFLGKYKPARPYIGKIPNPIWRILYFLTVNFFKPFALIISLGYLVGVNLLPHPFWLIIAVLVPPGVIGIYSVIKKERPLIVFYGNWFSSLLLITIVSLAFRNADGVDGVGISLYYKRSM